MPEYSSKTRVFLECPELPQNTAESPEPQYASPQVCPGRGTNNELFSTNNTIRIGTLDAHRPD